MLKNYLLATIVLINRLRKDSNWVAVCDKALKIHLLPPKVRFDGVTWKQKSGRPRYDNIECVHVMDWLKNLRHEFRDIGNLHWVCEINVSILNDIIQKAEIVLNEYTTVLARYEALLIEIAGAVRKLRTNKVTVVTHLKASESWTHHYLSLLDIHQKSAPANFTTVKPAAELVNRVTYIQINFSKTGISGVNVYTRSQGEIDFSFLGFAKRSRYKDPRPLDLYVSQTRDYRLTAVMNGEEIGQQSDVLSIRIG